MTTVRETRRWRGVVGVALAALALGVLFKRPLLVLASVVGVTYAVYPRLTPTPTVMLEIERSLDEDDPEDGDEVTVTVDVHNVGGNALPDLRLVDGVPPMLAVADGSPRLATSLTPRASTSFSYTVTARQGTHHFEPATVVARDLAGATEVETTVADDTAIEVHSAVPEAPRRQRTRQFVGDVVTDDGGSGVEFHRTRDYRRGDPRNRIDWRRYARSGELSTVEFRQERSASVVLCVDVREPAYRAANRDEPHGVAYSLAAVEQLLASLSESTDTVGLASLGAEGEDCWLAPGTGTEHRERARRLLGTHPALSAYPPEDPGGPDAWAVQLRDLQRRLPPAAQVVFVTPLADEFAASAVLTLEARRRAPTVVTPDVTSGTTPGARLARAERDQRIRSLREAGVRVVDWEPDKPLGTTIVDARERWLA